MTILQGVMLCPDETVTFYDPRIPYPMFASGKMDGIRFFLPPGKVFFSRHKVRFKNRYMISHFDELMEIATREDVVFDGEFWSPDLTFSQIQSYLTSHDKPLPSHLKAYVFDALLPVGDSRSFRTRFGQYQALLGNHQVRNAIAVPQFQVSNSDEAIDFHNKALASGYEGSILRNPIEIYHHGRVKADDGIMFRFKQFETSDGKIVKVYPMESLNADRGNCVGSFEIELADGTITGIGFARDPKSNKAWSLVEKAKLWERREELIGKCVEFKWQPHGTKDKPRIGGLLRFRPDKD